MKIILGSQSQRRREILRKMGYEFEVLTSGFDERDIRDSDPQQLTLKLARAKADILSKKIKEPALFITADIVGLCNGEILKKPKSKEEARRYLKNFGKYPLETFCAVVITNTKNNKRVQGVDKAVVFFSPIPDKVIEQLVNQKETYDYAAAFTAVNPLISQYIERIEGEVESVLGLPKKLTQSLIIKSEV